MFFLLLFFPSATLRLDIDKSLFLHYTEKNKSQQKRALYENKTFRGTFRKSAENGRADRHDLRPRRSAIIAAIRDLPIHRQIGIPHFRLHDRGRRKIHEKPNEIFFTDVRARRDLSARLFLCDGLTLPVYSHYVFLFRAADLHA